MYANLLEMGIWERTSTVQYNFDELKFSKYPDVLDVKQMSEILKVSTKTCYSILKRGEIIYRKVGREYRIPKSSIKKYLQIGKQ